MIQIDHVTFSYGEETEHTGGVRDIELQIKRGEFAVLCGESGCGKTTITRLINGLIPHYYEGKMSGGVWVNGAEVSKQPLYDTAKIVGSVFQNPRSQNNQTTIKFSMRFLLPLGSLLLTQSRYQRWLFYRRYSHHPSYPSSY